MKLFKINVAVDYDEDFYVLAENEGMAESLIKEYHAPNKRDWEFEYYTIDLITTTRNIYFDKNVYPYITSGNFNNEKSTETVGEILKRINDEKLSKQWQEEHQIKIFNEE